jgi:thimet oligopeptidase
MRTTPLILSAILLSGCQTSKPPGAPPAASAAPRDIKSFQQLASRFNSVLSVPEWETTKEAVKASVEGAIAKANKALDSIGKLKPSEVHFNNTIGALDDIRYEAGLAANRAYLIKETGTVEAIRELATEMIKVMDEWSVGLDYREDVYRAVKAYADTHPRLQGEDRKLLDETMRDYRRAGLHLPKAERDEVEKMRKDLSGMTTDFQSNITKTQKALKFTREELEGVPDDFLAQKGIKTGPNEYTVMINVTFQYIAIMDNAKREATRERLATEYNNLAREKNVPLLQKIMELRDKIARKLGYATWADYEIEPKMAKNAATARKFLVDLQAGLQPKFEAEMREFQALKAKETGDSNARIRVWDWRYFSNRLKKEKYTVDAEQLRVFFPYEKALQGMFNIYQTIFQIQIQEIEPPYKWIEDLKLFVVSDAGTREPLGLFYLDMFPREGKYNHFAQFGIIEGKKLSDGRYQRPTAALICNFPPPQKDKPSLLSHSDVETLFHEFGHAMHTILTRAKFARFSGTSVPRDFVEAPSQMLENWVWDKKVLDSFAADYRDPTKKIPAEIIARLKEAKLATVGTHYRRQLSFALLDLALHTEIREGTGKDCVKVSNDILSSVFLPVPPDTAFVAFFGHLMGYDAGYYGYAWADAIAADMATVFEKSPRGFQDTKAGKRLRDEVYSRGDSRDATVSIRAFLGREQSIQPFLKTLGIGK